MNPGADHSYGICLGVNSQSIYMSFQHTDVVLRYESKVTERNSRNTTQFSPMNLPPALMRQDRNDNDHNIYNKPSHYYDYFPGTFYQFGKPRQQHRSQQGIRSLLLLHTYSDNSLRANNDILSNKEFLVAHPHGIGATIGHLRQSHSQQPVIVNSILWIANEDIDGILLVDVQTGMAIDVIVIHNPISLFFDPKSSRIFVSSKRKHWEGAIFAINPYTYRVSATYTNNRMNHPTGILVHDGVLFVAEQITAQIMKFDVESKEFLGVAISDIPGEIEHILLTNC